MKHIPIKLSDLANTAAGKRLDNQHHFHQIEKSAGTRKKVKTEKDSEPPNKEKAHIHQVLLEWCDARELKLKTEYSFHYSRKWRFDWAIPAKKIALEYEGVFSEKSRHTTVTGFTGDTEKYNTAQALDWKVIRLTALNFKQLVYLLTGLDRACPGE